MLGANVSVLSASLGMLGRAVAQSWACLGVLGASFGELGISVVLLRLNLGVQGLSLGVLGPVWACWGLVWPR